MKSLNTTQTPINFIRKQLYRIRDHSETNYINTNHQILNHMPHNNPDADRGKVVLDQFLNAIVSAVNLEVLLSGRIPLLYDMLYTAFWVPTDGFIL